MSNSIPPLGQPSLPETASNPAGGQAVPPVAPAAAAQAAQAAQTDQVTLSPAAQSGSNLFAAAQTASGVDQATVASIRAQLANGTYDVSPENLAQAIAAVLKETKP